MAKPVKRVGPIRALSTAAVALLTLASMSFGERVASASAVGDHSSAIVTVGNLQVKVPDGWSVRRLVRRCGHSGRGLLIANLRGSTLNAVRHDTRGLPPGSCTTVWDVAPLPPSYVMVDISRFDFPIELPASRFPLTLKDFEESPLDCRCSFRSGYVSYRGLSYAVRIWSGERARRIDRRRLAQLIGSISPKRRS